jgi:phospholipid/cholesterol/gamma-HCH transport system ATP-binding protein
MTSIVVTHDMYSVKNVANKVAMMHEGKIYFIGSQEEEFIKRTEE